MSFSFYYYLDYYLIILFKNWAAKIQHFFYCARIVQKFFSESFCANVFLKNRGGFSPKIFVAEKNENVFYKVKLTTNI